MTLPKRHLARWMHSSGPLRWLLAMLVRVWIPRHYVGAVGAVFNQAGQVLLLEHVFRTYYPWGLPGGWVERGENPAQAVSREVKEELGMRIEVKQLLLCQTQGGNLFKNTTPWGLGLVYYCRLVDEAVWLESSHTPLGYEILSLEWANPAAITQRLSPLESRGIMMAAQLFEQEKNVPYE